MVCRDFGLCSACARFAAEAGVLPDSTDESVLHLADHPTLLIPPVDGDGKRDGDLDGEGKKGE
jgi:hypothetical protein